MSLESELQYELQYECRVLPYPQPSKDKKKQKNTVKDKKPQGTKSKEWERNDHKKAFREIARGVGSIRINITTQPVVQYCGK